MNVPGEASIIPQLLTKSLRRKGSLPLFSFSCR